MVYYRIQITKNMQYDYWKKTTLKQIENDTNGKV